MTELTPSVADIVEFQLPESVRVSENELFIQFIKYYYDWLTQKGQPTEFLHDILSYKDIDLASPDFRRHLLGLMTKLMPANMQSDNKQFSKQLATFLRSKGTMESFEGIMRAMFNEEMEMEWNSSRVFRPSASEHTRVASVAIQSSAPWATVDGSTLIQTFPSPASAAIESCTSTVVGGKHINWLILDEKTVVGKFEVAGTVKALHNNINRNFYFEEEYYTPIKLSNNLLKFKAVKEEARPYDNLIVRQLNSTFRARVSQFIRRKKETGYSAIDLQLSEMTGTFIPGNEVYFFVAAIEPTMYLKTDFEYGTVSPAIGEVKITNAGALYTPGDKVKFIGGDGANVDAYVSEVHAGPINQITIQSKGHGYTVGDKLVITEEMEGGGLAAEVSHIDGTDAAITLISELNTIKINNGGYGYAVGDTIEVIGGTRVHGTPFAKFQVATVDAAFALLAITPTAKGYGYPMYTRLSLIDTTNPAALAVIPGLQAKILFNPARGIDGVTITAAPAITTNNLAIAINGYGATATASIVAGQLSSLTITNGGLQYIDPIAVINGDGTGASATLSKTNGVITGYTITGIGQGYTAATVVIKERYGTGATLTPIIRDATGNTGSITSLTVLDRGNYYNLPACFNVSSRTVSGSGSGALFDYDFRGKIPVATRHGHFYHAVATSIAGRGEGAVLVAEQTAGAITNVAVLNGGKNYYHGTTVTIPGGTLQCSLSPVIVGGVITAVTINSPGTGYTPPELLGITINSGTAATLTTTISGIGRVLNASLVNGGTGYKSSTEVTPLALSASIGTGAILLPVLTEDGSFDRVEVVHGGEGYSISSLISITGGGGSAAVLAPVVLNGAIVSVTVTAPGTLYKYGTTAYVIGDGAGAVLTPVVETGLSSVEIVAGGKNYSAAATITVVDATGSGAVVRPTIVDGVITELVIVAKGSGYTAPTLTIVNPGSGTGADIRAVAKRAITSLTLTNGGAGYTYADVFILGDGEGADFALAVEKLGSIDTVTLTLAGAGYTTTPIVTVTDNSGYGAVSGIRITNAGGGYKSLPRVVLPNKLNVFGAIIATGATFTCFGSRVGGIKKVSFNNHGAAYTNVPKVAFGMKALLKENSYFKVGEEVRIASGKDIGLKATVRAFDYERHSIELEGLNDDFFLVTENDIELITEQGFDLLDEESDTFEAGEVIVGQKSKARATIAVLNRAEGVAIKGGNGWTDFKFVNEVGMTNTASSVIADNNRYQDRAYVIRTGRSINDYREVLKNTVHPAGFAMFGDVKTQAYLHTHILEEIGYNKLATLLSIFSIVANVYESEWTEMDVLFGEFTKFNYDKMPISLVQNYTIRQTSRNATFIVPGYYAPPMNNEDMHTWALVNNLQISEDVSHSPNGKATIQRIADVYSLGVSSVTKTVITDIGMTYSIETYIGKQTNPLTYPEIALGTSYIRLNTMTGAIYTNMPANMYIVADVGDFWWVRLKYVAVNGSAIGTISPAKGEISNMAVPLNSAMGSIKVADTYIRDLAGLTPYNQTLRAWNSAYVPDMFRVLGTEAQIALAAFP